MKVYLGVTRFRLRTKMRVSVTVIVTVTVIHDFKTVCEPVTVSVTVIGLLRPSASPNGQPQFFRSTSKFFRSTSN